MSNNKFKEMSVNFFNEILDLNKKNINLKMKSVIEEFDNAMLECDMAPNEAMEFLLNFFSCEKIYETKGIEALLLEMNVDSIKYNFEQKQKILNVLLKNAGNFSNPLVRHAIGDFIARAYPFETSFATFKLFAQGFSPERHIAFVGFDVLRMRNKNSDQNFMKIMTEWQLLFDSQAEWNIKKCLKNPPSG